MDIKPVIKEALAPTGSPANPSAAGDGKFGDLLHSFLADVNDLQIKSDAAVKSFAAGEEADLHKVVVAISKADLAFRYMLEVRNKLVDAYTEIMRTPL